MELKHCRAFVAVAEELHFGRAADRLYMAQPPLSRRIRELERDLGVRLLDRTTRSVSLTEPGSTFLEDARQLLRLADRAVTRARQSELPPTGRVRVGYAGATGFEVLALVLTTLLEHGVDVPFTIQEGSSERLLHAVRDGELDVALVRPGATKAGVDVEPLFIERLVVALADSHPLADRRTLRLADVARERFVAIARERDTIVHDHIVEVCRSAGFYPVLADEAVSVSAVLLLVVAGRGIAIVPSLLSDQVQFPRLVFRKIDDPPAAIGLAVASRSHEESAMVTQFVEAVVASPLPPGLSDARPGRHTYAVAGDRAGSNGR